MVISKVWIFFIFLPLIQTVGWGGGGGCFWVPPLKSWITSKPFNPWPPNLATFPKIYLDWIIDSKLRKQAVNLKVFNSITSSLIPSRIGIWKCCFFKERGKTEYPKKTSGSKGENQQQTQPTLTWRRRQDLNPGNIRGRRRVLSSLRHPYPSLKMAMDL